MRALRVLRHLAPAAELERDDRERDYPAFVRRGLVDRADANADLQAWDAIALWCAGERSGSKIEIDEKTLVRWDPERAKLAEAGQAVPPAGSNWETLELAAAKALRHLDRQRAATPDDSELAARRGRVAAILAGLQCTRAFYDDLAEALRARATGEAVEQGAGAPRQVAAA